MSKSEILYKPWDKRRIKGNVRQFSLAYGGEKHHFTAFLCIFSNIPIHRYKYIPYCGNCKHFSIFKHAPDSPLFPMIFSLE